MMAGTLGGKVGYDGSIGDVEMGDKAWTKDGLRVLDDEFWRRVGR